MEIIKQPLLWLISGILIGIGFVGAFSGGSLLLLVGLIIAVTLFFRTRGHRQGWPALLYGTGVTTAVLLWPYLARPSPCVGGAGAGCYQAFTATIFGVALVLAGAGLAFAVIELRHRGRS